ncbi:uncharacterized protein BDZ99DRAFT_466171 [Mytilinidion resinicola]|uniref:Uncharacterized protein n=1 Tax=Mytilinidion resinicola TaxID=574789 RepID=A0A6A6YD96_9PEZI|nr:uncharacterized protein BDZ99DRAFT_466171 [Mytilinidion resinicola]KAF2805817.1 hypothetical protein BDZ99DRAFT_466171 [Mytilinidion resinicola]
MPVTSPTTRARVCRSCATRQFPLPVLAIVARATGWLQAYHYRFHHSKSSSMSSVLRIATPSQFNRA